MATTKNTKKAVVKAQSAEKEVDFADIEDFKIAKPELTEANGLVVTTNFDRLAGKIKAIVDRYKGTELTEDNVDYVKTLKSHFVSLRTGIERERKEWKKVYIDPASNTVKAVCDDLLKIVDEGESALGIQLDLYDQKRKDELTMVLNGYVEDSCLKHGLRPEYAQQITLKKEYYNKTQDEECSADDIEAQAVELEKKQKELDAGVALINSECEGSTLVPETYIEQLKYKSPTEIILQIKGDKKRNAELMAEMKAKEDAGEKIVIGEPVSEGLTKALECQTAPVATKADKEDGMRTRTVQITYRAELSGKIMDFFEENGIQVKFLKG